MSKELSTAKNIAAIKETFDMDNFHPADAYNHLMKLNNWLVKGIHQKFELIGDYKNKRVFAKLITSLASYIIENKL